MRYKIHNIRSGFTLIEAVIVLALFVFLSSMSWLSLSNYFATSGLNVAASQIIAVLYDAQSRSLTQEDGLAWGVVFTNGAESDSFSLFRGSAGNIVSTYRLRGNVVFVDPSDAEMKSVLFQKITGAPQNVFTITLGITGRSITRVIEISEYGSINRDGFGEYQGLVGYWKMDRVISSGGGTFVTPDVARDNDGELVNGPTLITDASQCMRGLCLNFDGVDDYINLSAINLSGSHGFSISAWVKADIVDGGLREIIRQDFDGTPDFLLSFQGEGYCDSNASICLAFGLRTDSGYDELDTGEIAVEDWLNKWVHIVATYGNNIKTIYVNGSAVHTDEDHTGSLVFTQEALSSIGRSPVSNSEYFSGSMDDVRIYNRTLSSNDVEKLYKSYLSNTTSASLIAHWKFNEASGESASDSAGNNHGTLIGDAMWDGGKIGNAVRLDGAGDYVTISENSNFNFGSAPFTVTAWVYFDNINGDQSIVSKGQASHGSGWWLLQQGNNHIWFCVNTSGNNDCTGATQSADTVAAGQWYHVAGVRDAQGRMQVYLNGVGGTLYTGQENLSIIASNDDLKIGIYGDGVYAPFDGFIDDVRIYSGALTASQIQALANQ